MKCNLNMKSLDLEAAKKLVDDLIEGFELDLLDKESNQLERIKTTLAAPFQRGRLEFSTEDLTVTYHLKKPIQFTGDSDDPLASVVFSLDNCDLSKTDGMENFLEKGNFKPVIINFAGAKTPLLTNQSIKKMGRSDYAVCGVISTLFLAF